MYNVKRPLRRIKIILYFSYKWLQLILLAKDSNQRNNMDKRFRRDKLKISFPILFLKQVVTVSKEDTTNEPTIT